MSRHRVKVMAFGAFDVLHLGHLRMLKQAQKLGDRLVVVVASDAILEKGKGHKAYFNEDERRELVASFRYVDKAIRGDRHNTLEPILKEKPDVIAFGYDQPKKPSELLEELKSAGLRKLPKIVRLKPFKTGRHKSSKVKRYFEKFV